MFLRVDDVDYKVDLGLQSESLASADDATKRHFVLSPSGYGIHWPDLDEELSIDGLIRAAKVVSSRG